MRLLQLKDGDNFSLVERIGNNIPRYAILSHTWGEDKDEISVRDLVDGTGRNKAGYRKIRFCGEQAAKDRLEYFWVDTCCIDKSSSAELQEAINSMFQWYYKAAKCYVYLSDVSFDSFVNNDQSFQKSRWFTRGWTLQELVAPTCVEFFSLEGKRIGDKDSMVQEVHQITGIPIQALQGSPLSQFSIDERRSWAANRQTKREEDAAYSLLGIFDIHMPLIYGEGRKNAFARLERKTKKSSSAKLPTEPSKHRWGPFSSDLSGEDQEFVEHSDVPGLLSTYIEASERIEGYQDFEVTTRRTVPELESNKPRPQVKASVVGLSDGKRMKIHDPWVKDQDLEAVLNGILSYARDHVDADEHTRLRLRNDSEAHDEALADILELPEDKEKDKKKASGPTFMSDELNGGSRRRGKSGHQVEPFQNATNTLSNFVPPINPAPHLWQQSTQLEGYLKDQQIQDRIGYASVQEILQFLLDRRLRASLESQNVVNDWLDVTRFNDRNNVARYYDKQVSSRLEGTCEWIFSHPAYHAWISEEHPDDATRVLWIHAPAGYGKTVLCAKLVEHLKDKQSFPVVHFFASPHAQSGGDPSFIIRSWISQITQLDSNILDLVRRHSEVGQKASESAIWSLFQSIVSENRNFAFVLDGFDEYSRLEDARTEFLQKLKEATKRTAARILFTSRDETDINTELSPKITQDTGHVILQCRITNEDVRRDIFHFSRSVVDKKLPNKDDRLREDLAGQLAEKCEGMFLWIRLQQDQLRGGKNAKQLQNIVKNMPIGLEKTYERNWKIIQSHPPEEQNRALAILRWTTFALRPLTVSEITEALLVELNDDGATIQWDELPDNIDDEYINSEIIDICGALVEIRTEKPGVGAGTRTIHLIHSSVREFLLSTLNSKDSSQHSLRSDPTSTQAEHHECLAMVCLGYICCDDTWQQRTTQMTDGRRCNFTHYAARHWNAHMTAAGKDNPKLVRQLKGFFHAQNENFDSWRRHVEASEATVDENEEKDRGTATPLYYAALFNLPAVMKNIWAEDPTQLDRVGGEYGTPLQAVCYKGHEEAFQLLLDWGADPNVEGGRFGISINAAIAGGQRSMVQTLMHMGVDLTLQDSMGRTPLYTAAMIADCEIFGWLIEAGAHHGTANRYGWTPLNSAANRGHLEVVKLLLEKGADIAVASSNGWTALNLAANRGHLEVVKLLLEKGADIAVASSNGWTPLNSAADRGHLEVVKLLLEKGADIAVASSNGWTALNLAANRGHLEVVKLLLEKGADIAVAISNGWTALNLAADKGHLEVIKLLLEKGADIAVASSDGWTPLNSAADRGHLEVVKLLLEKGAYAAANGIDSHYGTIINLLAFKGQLELLRLTYEQYHANMYLADTHGRTPLLFAARGGHMDTFQYLINLGLDPTTVDAKGDGILCYASSGGSFEVLSAALNKDVKSLCKSTHWSPLHWACRAGKLEVVELLINEGLHSEPITIPELEGQWCPLDIAIYHGNDEMLENLSTSYIFILGAEANTVRPRGKRHGSYGCDGCMHEIYGPRFHCRKCRNLDYCFMCKPFLESLHKNHEWDYFESHD